MIHNDYILRMISQLAKVLAHIVQLREKGRDDDALREIDQSMQKLCGLNSQLVNSLSESSLIAAIRGGASLDVGKCLVLAGLLKEEGDLMADRDLEDDAAARYLKSLALYLEAMHDDARLHLPSYVERVQEVAGSLEEFVMPLDIRTRLMSYYELSGAFGAAEDVLFDMLEDEEDDAPALGADFYGRMLELTDDELDSGDLPRDEVLEGLERVRPATT
ncbi:MAG: hypothetical protein IPF53_23025 [Blastocatellia bacterium]|nr:hypothetical protein [Blastocatellia bacterium]MBK6426247.1 hypothetical protein [Blastocatellia bacterium]